MITRRSQIAWTIASVRCAKPAENSSAPLKGERALWRLPWKGSVKSTMSQPSAKNSRRLKNEVLKAALEAPKPWIVISVACGPSSWRQYWARATALWVEARKWLARSGCSGSKGLWKRSSSTRPPSSARPSPGREWIGIGAGGGLNTLAGSWAEASVA